MTTVAPARAGRREWAALSVLALAVLLIAVDGTVLSLAVPALAADLQPSATELLWIGDAYSFVLAGLLVTMGALGDRIGRKRLLLVGAVGFALASALAAYAPTPGWLIAARALQGVAGATLMPATLSIIRATFADPRQRTLAVGIWSAAAAAGAAVGPLVGGVLLDSFWWGSVFLINLPVMVLLLALGVPLIPESRDPRPGPFDLTSAGLSLAGVLGIVYAVKELAAGEHPARAVAAGLAGAALLTVFVRRQRVLPAPLIDVRLFARRAFSGAVLSTLLAIFALSGLLFFLSQYFQLVLGLSALESGLRLLPAMAGAVISGVTAPLLLRRLSRAAATGGGLLTGAAGLALLVVAVRAGGYPLLAAATTLVGLGIGLALTVTSDTVVSSVPPARAGAASAVSETAYELGTALGIAVLGSVLTAVYRAGLVLPAGLPAEAVGAVRDSLATALGAAGALGPDGAAVADTARAAFLSGIEVAAGIGAALTACAALAAALLLTRRGDPEVAAPDEPVG